MLRHLWNFHIAVVAKSKAETARFGFIIVVNLVMDELVPLPLLLALVLLLQLAQGLLQQLRVRLPQPGDEQPVRVGHVPAEAGDLVGLVAQEVQRGGQPEGTCRTSPSRQTASTQPGVRRARAWKPSSHSAMLSGAVTSLWSAET
ncbi:hypothetical protein VTN02DRAFT_606 [Thermoascus thermophilus]